MPARDLREVDMDVHTAALPIFRRCRADTAMTACSDTAALLMVRRCLVVHMLVAACSSETVMAALLKAPRCRLDMDKTIVMVVVVVGRLDILPPEVGGSRRFLLPVVVEDRLDSYLLVVVDILPCFCLMK